MRRWRRLPGFDRRKEARSERDQVVAHRLQILTGAFWAACGLAVVIYLVLAAAGTFRPTEVIWLTAVIALLTITSLAHAALVLYRAGPGAARRRSNEDKGLSQ